jgi:hypothetical protein
MILAHGSFLCPLEILAVSPVLGMLWAWRHVLRAWWGVFR